MGRVVKGGGGRGASSREVGPREVEQSPVGAPFFVDKYSRLLTEEAAARNCGALHVLTLLITSSTRHNNHHIMKKYFIQEH